MSGASGNHETHAAGQEQCVDLQTSGPGTSTSPLPVVGAEPRVEAAGTPARVCTRKQAAFQSCLCTCSSEQAPGAPPPPPKQRSSAGLDQAEGRPPRVSRPRRCPLAGRHAGAFPPVICFNPPSAPRGGWGGGCSDPCLRREPVQVRTQVWSDRLHSPLLPPRPLLLCHSLCVTLWGEGTGWLNAEGRQEERRAGDMPGSRRHHPHVSLVF